MLHIFEINALVGVDKGDRLERLDKSVVRGRVASFVTKDLSNKLEVPNFSFNYILLWYSVFIKFATMFITFRRKHWIPYKLCELT